MVPSIDYTRCSDEALQQLAAHASVKFVRELAQSELDSRRHLVRRLASDVAWTAGWIYAFASMAVTYRASQFAQARRAALKAWTW
jgi:hypothetical protein